VTELPQLADELRAFLVESVSKTGGHLSSNLGTVELTVALHYVFDTPEDRMVWDVGHQTYAHKILTGRARHGALRMKDGVSGFPARSESEYDTFGVGHSPPRSPPRWAWPSPPAQGRGAARGGGHRRRRDDRRHGLRGAQQRRRDGRQPAGHPQRQRHVDLAAGRRAQQVPGPPAVRPHLQRRARAGEKVLADAPRRCNSPSAPRSTSRA
jgi:hypothetical protein